MRRAKHCRKIGLLRLQQKIPLTSISQEVMFVAECKTLTKTDLGLVLLKNICTYDASIILRMLALVDDDNDGTINVNELQACVKQMDPNLVYFAKALVR